MAVGRGGTVVLFGGCAPGTSVRLDTRRAHYEELTLVGAFHHTPALIRRAVELLASRAIDPDAAGDPSHGAGAGERSARDLMERGETHEGAGGSLSDDPSQGDATAMAVGRRWPLARAGPGAPAAAFDPRGDLRPGHDDLRTAGRRRRGEQHRGPPDRQRHLVHHRPRGCPTCSSRRFGSGLLRSALEPGLEGWFQHYLSPNEATAQGAQARGALPSASGFGRLRSRTSRRTAGAGGTSLRVPEIDSAFTFVLEAGAGLSYFVTDTARCQRGLSLPAHLERAHLQPEPGLQLGHRVGGVSFYFK